MPTPSAALVHFPPPSPPFLGIGLSVSFFLELSLL